MARKRERMGREGLLQASQIDKLRIQSPASGLDHPKTCLLAGTETMCLKLTLSWLSILDVRVGLGEDNDLVIMSNTGCV